MAVSAGLTHISEDVLPWHVASSLHAMEIRHICGSNNNLDCVVDLDSTNMIGVDPEITQGY